MGGASPPNVGGAKREGRSLWCFQWKERILGNE